MLAGGVLLMVLGALGMLMGSGTAAVSGVAGGLLLMGGAGLFAIGVLMAIGGAIANAVRENTTQAAVNARGIESAIKVGVESLWKQLDAIRQLGGGVVAEQRPLSRGLQAMPDPPASSPASAPYVGGSAGVMGKCPGCGRLRGTTVASCVYCKNTDPVPAK